MPAGEDRIRLKGSTAKGGRPHEVPCAAETARQTIATELGDSRRGGKLEAERTKLLAEARRLDNNTTLDVVKLLVAVYAAIFVGVKAAESPGWL